MVPSPLGVGLPSRKPLTDMPRSLPPRWVQILSSSQSILTIPSGYLTPAVPAFVGLTSQVKNTCLLHFSRIWGKNKFCGFIPLYPKPPFHLLSLLHSLHCLTNSWAIGPFQSLVKGVLKIRMPLHTPVNSSHLSEDGERLSLKEKLPTWIPKSPSWHCFLCVCLLKPQGSFPWETESQLCLLVLWWVKYGFIYSW